MKKVDKKFGKKLEVDAQLNINGHIFALPVIEGTQGERGLDITKLYGETGYVTIDPGFANTASCFSEIS
jgi:citrate synthase